MKLLVDNRQDDLLIDKKLIKLLKLVILKTLEIELGDTNFEVSLSFVSEEEIKKLNAEYRLKNTVTDVLSFPLEDDFAKELLGDIVICTKRALEQAREYGHCADRELAYLTAHSTLHLLGYDHEEDNERLEMRQKEKRIMKSLGIFK